MKRGVLLIIAVLPAAAAAQYRPLETVDEQRQRRQADRYEQLRDRGYRGEALGGRRPTHEIGPRESESAFESARRRDRAEDLRSPLSPSGGGYLEPVVPKRRY